MANKILVVEDEISIQNVRRQNECLDKVIDLISSGFFSPEEPHLFMPIIDSLLKHGDRYMVLADFNSYIECQNALEKIYSENKTEWTKMSIRNVANMGYFSSDRTISEYAKDIWNVKPEQIILNSDKIKKAE